MEEIYVVKVRTQPDPARLYPSERRYSALTVGGLGAVHLLLAATSLLLGGLGLALQSDSCWTGRYGGGLWLGLAAAAAGAAGILAWRRWYVDNNIRWFFICSTVAATTSLLCLVITAAVLAAVQEQRSNQELYKSIYYDQGFIRQRHTVGNNTIEELPSLSLQGSQQNDNHLQDTHVLTEENTELPYALYPFTVMNQHLSQKLNDSPEQATVIGILDDSKAELNHKASEHSASEYEEAREHERQTGIAPGNSIQKPNTSVYDIMNISTDTLADQYSETWKQREPSLEIKTAEYTKNGDRLNSTVERNDYESLQDTDIRKKTESESVHIMWISNIKASKPNYVDNKTLNVHDQKIDPPTNTNSEDQFNRQKKFADNFQREYLVENNDQHQGMVVTEDEHIYPKIFSKDETQDIMTMPSIKYESPNEDNVTEIHNFDDSNQTLSRFLSSKQRSEQEQPQHEKLPRSAREVRTVVAINILVASALELAWSLLSANIAWKGMRNCYPHENNSNNCERNVEGLERLPPPPPPSSNDTHIHNKRNHKTDGMFRKPDIISNHRHCHPENSFHLTAIQNKNGINRLHMVNTVSERINIEPYLPMEESTMEYQERVHRFLASNNVASDSASNFDS